MEKKEKNTFGKIPNRPYFVWIVIVCAIIMLVSLPRGGAGKIQTLDTKQLMTAVQNDSLLEISIRNDPSAGKDWYVVEGKMKNPVYGLEDAPKDAPRALEFVFSGRITDEMYKRLTYRLRPWEVKEVPSQYFLGELGVERAAVLNNSGRALFSVYAPNESHRQKRDELRKEQGAPAYSRQG